MYSQAIFVGIVANELFVAEKDGGEQRVSVKLIVKENHKEENMFSLIASNNDAINFKRKVSKGDLVYISAQPFSARSKTDKTNWSAGFRIQTYKVLKKKDFTKEME